MASDDLAKELLDLAERGVAAGERGPVWFHASVANVLRPLLDERDALRAALKEALELATPSRGMADPRRRGPYILDMRPMYSRVGDVVTDDRLAELRKLVGE